MSRRSVFLSSNLARRIARIYEYSQRAYSRLYGNGEAAHRVCAGLSPLALKIGAARLKIIRIKRDETVRSGYYGTSVVWHADDTSRAPCATLAGDVSDF